MSFGLFQKFQKLQSQYCVHFQDEGRNFQMSRGAPGSVMINESAWWVTGGPSARTTSEILVEGNQNFQFFHDLPEQGSDQGSCNLKLNNTHYFLTEGFLGKKSYIMNIEDPNDYLFLNDMDYYRDFSACGLITREDGSVEIVVAGGGSRSAPTDTSEIFSFKTMTWRQGPLLPYAAVGIVGVQLETTFLAVGGSSDSQSFPDEKFKNLLQYDTINDDWISLPQKMEAGGWAYTAFFVDRDSVNCQDF